ncbi:MAG: amino acid adenylation domain-containing protein, partial [Desulfobacteraceae bacterium]
MPNLAKSACIHELFESQVDIRPNALAVICGARYLTYQKLEIRSNRLAHYLRSCGVGPGRLVGLFFQRSEYPIIALLSVFKAGGGYVPLDPEYPMERVRHILSDTKVTVLLTEKALAKRAVSFFDGTTIYLDAQSEEIEKWSDHRLSRNETGVSPNDLCYLIYTSGTTGRPKGIMTEHRNVVQFVAAFNSICRLNYVDRVYQGFSLGFDGSVEEIWMAFSNGATLIVGTPEVVRFGSEVARLLWERKVTFFSTVPTFLSMINEDLPSVRLLVVSGEQCPPELVAKWARPGRRMLNVYGPTETTVNTTAAECSPEKPITIGRPLNGYDIHILDDNMQPVSKGKAGELYIGGIGVARGYLNQSELTAKQFVPNPFNGDNPAQKLYRTGDLVRMTKQGELSFLGRIDSQVKIRGFRIELSEIESVIREHPSIHSAAVNVHQHDGLKELAAYAVLEDGHASLNRNDLLSLLRKRLPVYMIP